MTLFDVPPPLARTNDPETSKAAARAVKHSGSVKAILDAFTRTDNWTASELGQVLGFYPPTVSSALSRLGKAGVLVRRGDQRRSLQGCWQDVWIRA